MIRKCLALILLAVGIAGWAKDVKTVKMAGPYRVHQPVLIDSVDAAQKKFSPDGLFDSRISLLGVREGQQVDVEALNADTTLRGGIVLVGFSFDAAKYTKVEVKATGPRKVKVYVDGHEASGKRPYQRGQYDVVVKYLADTAKLSLSLVADNDSAIAVVPSATSVAQSSGVKGQSSGADAQSATARRPFSMADNMQMKHYMGLQVSPSGRYAMYSVYGYDENGRNPRRNSLIDLSTGRKLMQPANGMRWMPNEDRLLKTEERDGHRVLLSVNPVDQSEQVVCADMPDDGYVLSPTGDFAVLTHYVEGPQREKDVYEILTPDDRQGGWRNRASLSLLDLKTGLVQPLTFGHHSLHLNDISADGRYILFSVSDHKLNPLGSADSLKETDTPPRPTDLTSVLRLDLKTNKVDTLIRDDGFLGSIAFVPGEDKLIIKGSAEALGGVGNILPDTVIPSAYDYQLFLFDIPTRRAVSLTRDFVPSVSAVKAAKKGGIIFFTANNEDSVSLYRLSLSDRKITRINQPCEVVDAFDINDDGSALLLYGTSACSPDALYAIVGKEKKPCVLDDANADRMARIDLGSCHALRFQSQRGYTLTGHYYLPAHFDPAKKYPVIVHYYGGCTPTSRRFGGGSHYPAHYWNAMGYIVLICNPSGASGFGAEWAARHVNTMGEGVAEDIIETVRQFAQNPWVDEKKIGCISASYGGFMTQLLLTETDLFAAGVSHAGISDHTSYWGEGYWGYTYSQVCAANSYPWTRKDLFVDRSPLYNAQKIHKPLLFTHGTADTNVPIGESIQMYTALKLLGRPTAFVMVEGENHGIMDFHKRQKWINTIVAWFDRWLKGEPDWWNAIYKPKDL